MLKRLVAATLIAMSAIGLAGCQDEKIHLTVLSGSENKPLESMITEWGSRHGADINFIYEGSVDIRNALIAKSGGFDAVWPASSIWLDAGDGLRPQHAKSIFTSPIVLAMREEPWKRSGFGNEVGYAEIARAVQDGKFRMAMTSATQSNSGAASYLGLLNTLAGSPDALSIEDISHAEVISGARDFFSLVDRSSGSSGWLGEAFSANPQRFDAMFNYEAVALDTNARVREAGEPPLRVVYIRDGAAPADSPLAFIPRKGGADDPKEKKFLELQDWLISPDTAVRIAETGRRPSGIAAAGVSGTVWKSASGVDPTRDPATIRPPASDVIMAALNAYQTDLRKPSLTAWVVDLSGSMEGQKLADVKNALHMILDPELAKANLLQASSRDKAYIIPFSSATYAPIPVDFSDPDSVRNALRVIDSFQAEGGTMMYPALQAALETVKNNEGYLTAVIALTDGRSDDAGMSSFLTHSRGDVPVFSIGFGDADYDQLKRAVAPSGGRVFDASKNIAKGLREAKGYN